MRIKIQSLIESKLLFMGEVENLEIIATDSKQTLVEITTGEGKQEFTITKDMDYLIIY